MRLPDLPELPAGVQDSMLSRRVGRETANYFANSPLNRLSFLRGDHDFLRAAFAHPSAAFVLLDGLSPMVRGDDASRLAFARHADVAPLLAGRDPFAGRDDDDAAAHHFDSLRTQPLLVFLGVDEGEGGSHVSSGVSGTGAGGRKGGNDNKINGDRRTRGGDAQGVDDQEGGGGGESRFQYKAYGGSPYWAVDVTPRGTLTKVAEALIAAMKAKGLAFYNSSPRHMGLPAEQAAMYAQARHLIDWNTRHPFCAQCGQATISVHAGFKRMCPPRDLTQGPCATHEGASNVSFPRTDTVVIVAVVSADGRRVLLGRQRKWLPGRYSALAGFLEPGESVEDAVRREVWEESGVRTGRVALHSSQPWPFPANLMIGAVAQALPAEPGGGGDGCAGEGGPEAEGGKKDKKEKGRLGGTGRSPETIFLGNDAELEDARWVTMGELSAVLARSASSPLGDATPPGAVEELVSVPSHTAIANRLLAAVVEGWGFSPRIQ